MADPVGALDTELVHQADGIGRHLVDRIVDLRIGALPATAVIVDDGAVAVRKGRDLLKPDRPAAAEAGHEHDRVAVTGFFVKNFGVADINFWHGRSFLLSGCGVDVESAQVSFIPMER